MTDLDKLIAEVEALRKERDALRIEVKHAEQEQETLGADRDRLAAELAAAKQREARLVGAATPYVQPVQNADYGRQLRQHEALVAALAEVQARDEGAKG